MSNNTNPSMDTKDLGDSSEAVDHHQHGNAECVDNTTDEVGSEVREEVRTGTPGFITDEFIWVYSQTAINDEANRMLDKNWNLRPLPETIENVVEIAPAMLAARQIEIKGDKDVQERQNAIYVSMLDLFRTLMIENSWLLYGDALAQLSVGAKEIASSARFALKAREWALRDPKHDGPGNMTEAAYGQSQRGAMLINAVIQAYIEVTDESAQKLIIDARTFRTAAFTALGIEANKLKKKYDHPGKAAQRNALADEASTVDFDNLLGKKSA